MITAGSAAIKSLLLEKSIAARASSVNPADGSNAANGSDFSTSVLPSVSISLVDSASVLPSVSISLVDSASDSASVSTSVSIWVVSAVSSSGPRVSFAFDSSVSSPDGSTSAGMDVSPSSQVTSAVDSTTAAGVCVTSVLSDSSAPLVSATVASTLVCASVSFCTDTSGDSSVTSSI